MYQAKMSGGGMWEYCGGNNFVAEKQSRKIVGVIFLISSVWDNS